MSKDRFDMRIREAYEMGYRDCERNRDRNPDRALSPPAAAPAADYDPITAPIPAGDMNGPHGPAPAAETGKTPRVPELEPQSWCGVPIATPAPAQGAEAHGQCGDRADCDAAHARIAELEALVAEANRQLAKLAARAAQTEGEVT